MEIIGENVDHLVSLELRAWKDFFRGVTPKLYRYLREKTGRPTTLLAAERLKERVKEGDTVFIITGFRVPPYVMVSLNDGPLGAASLARPITLGLGGKVLILAEEECKKMLESTCRAAELRVVDESSFKSSERCTLVRGFPLSTVEEARKLSKKLFDEYSPKAIIAIERPGRNEKGVYHTGRGYDMSPWTAKLDYTFDEAKERGILTIGIGDYGNEAGLGQIREIVREVFPYGAKCRCPCGAGNATAVESDVGIIGSCSNTGAYGVTACLSALLGEPELLQSPELERIMLLECSKMGGADGLTKTCTLRVDGITADTYVSTVQILGEIIRQGLTEIHPLFH